MNDNSKDDPAPFIQLAAITANVTRFLLGEKQHPPHQQKGDADGRDAKNDQGKHVGREFLVA